MLLLASGVLAVLPWLYLLLLHGRFWCADQRLDAPPASADHSWPAVVAVIPARDEAAVIGASIASHLSSRYPGAFHLVLVDDASTGRTAEVAHHAAAAAGRAERLTVTAAPQLLRATR
jgi:hypothetical protein